MPTVASATQIPLRPLFLWPGATALVGMLTSVVQAERSGFGAMSVVIAGVAAASAGVWPGVLHAVVAWLVTRRSPRWAQRAMPACLLQVAATTMLSSVAMAICAWPLLAVALDMQAARPVDFVEVAVQLARGGLILMALPLVCVIAAVVWGVWRMLAWRPLWSRGVLAGALFAWVVAGWVHLSSGPFANYFGDVGVAVLLAWTVVMLAISTRAYWACGRLAVRGVLAFGLMAVLSLAALSDRSARNLLFADNRVFPRVHDMFLGPFDRDGDGAMPPWLGGEDCNDHDPLIAPHRPEEPDNGIDDNCFEGDAHAKPGPTPPTKRAPNGQSVVLVTLDAVRADALELYGGPAPTMPFLTALANAHGVVFDRAYAPSNHTRFSVLALLSGERPDFLLHTRDSFLEGQPRFTRWLPKAMHDAGYETFAVFGALFESDIAPESSYFDHVVLGPWDFAGKNRGTHSAQIVERTLGLLNRREQIAPAFVWIHIPDPHAVHESFLPLDHVPTQEPLRDAYRAELQWVDGQLQRLFQGLTTLMPDGFVFAVTADHGEALGERGEYGHGYSLREDQIHVPLVIAAPGEPARRVPQVVSIRGLASTLLERVGLPVLAPPAAPSMLSRKRWPTGVVASCPFFFADKRWDVAWVENDYKLIWGRRLNTLQLYHLATDPKELHDLAHDDPTTTYELLERVKVSLEHHERGDS